MFAPKKPSDQPENTFSRFTKYFSLVMTLVYPALGIFIFFSSDEQVRFDPTLKKMLGAVLFIYGIIRGMRVYQEYFKNRKRHHNED